MIRALRVLHLRCQAWWILAQLEHVDEQLASFRGRRSELVHALNRIVSRMNMAQSPANIIHNAMRKAAK